MDLVPCHGENKIPKHASRLLLPDYVYASTENYVLGCLMKQWGTLATRELRARQGRLRKQWAVEGDGAFGIWLWGWNLLACKQHNPELEELD